MTSQQVAKTESIREFRRSAETLLRLIDDVRETTESVQEKPKKVRKRQLSSGE